MGNTMAAAYRATRGALITKALLFVKGHPIGQGFSLFPMGYLNIMIT